MQLISYGVQLCNSHCFVTTGSNTMTTHFSNCCFFKRTLQKSITNKEKKHKLWIAYTNSGINSACALKRTDCGNKMLLCFCFAFVPFGTNLIVSFFWFRFVLISILFIITIIIIWCVVVGRFEWFIYLRSSQLVEAQTGFNN